MKEPATFCRTAALAVNDSPVLQTTEPVTVATVFDSLRAASGSTPMNSTSAMADPAVISNAADIPAAFTMNREWFMNSSPVIMKW
ncbi:hypothetical protein sS8_1529 [Methylocaldum marinum]|uniref:Uncharacterized protein n=1 Tax=Methylocaldum marinum TaxID=1432792 RepID=A0A250KPG9_9GAMM|nr:hypothetical protein sS8_1529 [Methylocaldum marinum]